MNRTKSTTVKAPKIDVYEQVTNELIAMLEKGVCPWKRAWKAIGGIPRNYKGRPYRGANAVLTAMHCMANEWEHPIFLTFKQVQECGGKVLKGSKSIIVIFASKTVPKKYAANPDACPANERRFMMRYYRVFNIAQTEGVKLPKMATGNDNEEIPDCAVIVDDMPNPPELGGGSPCYIPSKDLVLMPAMQAFDDSAHYYKTLFHELTHATGHETRLDRKEAFNNGFQSDPYAFEELIAELGASFLCGHAQIFSETKEQAAAYLDGWIQTFKGDKKFFFRAAAQAQKAVDYILGV